MPVFLTQTDPEQSTPQIWDELTAVPAEFFTLTLIHGVGLGVLVGVGVAVGATQPQVLVLQVSLQS